MRLVRHSLGDDGSSSASVVDPCQAKLAERSMVPGKGLEPSHLSAAASKTAVSTIPPPGQALDICETLPASGAGSSA